MRRRLAYALGIVLAAALPGRAAVDLTGTWNICEDCRGFGVCDPPGPPQPNTDIWSITQMGTALSKIVARATGLPMTVPLGAAGISIRFDDLSGGLPIVCAHFGAGSVRRDTPPVFVAGPSAAPLNCLASTLRAP